MNKRITQQDAKVISQSFGVRLERVLAHKRAREAAVKGEASTTRLLAIQCALGYTATENDWGEVVKGERKLTMGQTRALARLFRVPTAWLATGAQVLKDNQVVEVPGVGSRIFEARIARGLSLVKLSRAADLGNTAKNISRLEGLEFAPKLGTVQRIAKALHMSPSWLLYGNQS